jgi:hypothetical protein
MKSVFAISWFVCPSASRRSTSRSRSESGRRDPRPERRVDIAPACRNFANGLHELVVSCLLQDVAACPCGERLPNVSRVILHREHQNLDRGRLFEQIRSGLDAALPSAEANVHDNDVRLGGAELEDCLARIAGLAHSFDVVLRVEKQPKPGPNHGMIVD